MTTIKRLLSIVVIGVTALLGAGVTAAASGQASGPAVQGLPPFVATVQPVTAERLGLSWREGCPVGPDQLRLVTMTVLGFDGKAYRGELVVAADVAWEVVGTFAELYRDRYPIERMLTVEKYGADDDLSMAANNTSAFNCRAITGGNVYPPNGAPYADRTRTDQGLIHAGDPTVRAFERRGWDWGGYWDTPIDYQHVEKP